MRKASRQPGSSDQKDGLLNKVSPRNKQRAVQRQKGAEILLVNESECLFCSKFGDLPFSKIDFSSLLNKALYSKYSSVQKIHPSQEIEDLLQNESLLWVIKFKEQVYIDEVDEYLKRCADQLYHLQRFYKVGQVPEKLDQLLEYYKYHKDIPRFFMKNISKIALYYHEKKKFIEYQGIKKMLGMPLDQDPTSTNRAHFDGNPVKYSTLLNGLTQIKQISNQVVNQELPSRISTHTVLKELIKGISDRQSETWLSMPQQYSICDTSIKQLQDQSTGIHKLESLQDLSPVMQRRKEIHCHQPQNVLGQFRQYQVALPINKLQIAFEKKTIGSFQQFRNWEKSGVKVKNEEIKMTKKHLPSGLQSIQTLSSQNSPKMNKSPNALNKSPPTIFNFGGSQKQLFSSEQEIKTPNVAQMLQKGRVVSNQVSGNPPISPKIVNFQRQIINSIVVEGKNRIQGFSLVPLIVNFQTQFRFGTDI